MSVVEPERYSRIEALLSNQRCREVFSPESDSLRGASVVLGALAIDNEMSALIYDNSRGWIPSLVRGLVGKKGSVVVVEPSLQELEGAKDRCSRVQQASISFQSIGHEPTETFDRVALLGSVSSVVSNPGKWVSNGGRLVESRGQDLVVSEKQESGRVVVVDTIFNYSQGQLVASPPTR